MTAAVAAVLQWMPRGHRGKERPRNTWERDLEREMWTASLAGGRWRRQHKTEWGGDEWSVACA